MLVLLSICNNSDDFQILQLSKMGIMEVIVESLRYEEETISELLFSLRNLLIWGEAIKSSKKLNENVFAKMFEELGGLVILDEKMLVCQSEKIFLEIEAILELYF